MDQRSSIRSVSLGITMMLVCAVVSPASAGNIDPGNTGAAFAWGENVGWINFKPIGSDGVTVTATEVTGFAWGENVGWINFNPPAAGVTIDPRGRFTGLAWGENIGWINFGLPGPGVVTAWLPPDITPPTVTPPANITVRATEVDGVRANVSAALTAFVAGGSVTDAADPSPVRLAPTMGGVEVGSTTLFPLGANTMVFSYRDASGNVGSTNAVVTVTMAADLAVAIAGPSGTVRAGQEVTYTVTVTNRGPHEATGISLSATLPGNATFTSSSATCVMAGSALTCDVGALGAGSARDVTLRFTPTGAGPLTTTASAGSAVGDANAANNTASAVAATVLAGNIDPGGTGAAFAWGENVGWINFAPAVGAAVTEWRFEIPAPTDLKATVASRTEIALAWSDSTGVETGFEIERRSGSRAFVRIASAGAGARAFRDTHLRPDGTYTYRVRALRAAGPSAYSNESVVFLATGKLILSQPTVAFPTTRVGKARTQSVVIRNAGRSTLTGTVGALSAPFAVLAGGGEFSLAPGQSRTLTIEFAPASVGRPAATVKITSSDPVRPSAGIRLSGTAR